MAEGGGGRRSRCGATGHRDEGEGAEEPPLGRRSPSVLEPGVGSVAASSPWTLAAQSKSLAGYVTTSTGRSPRPAWRHRPTSCRPIHGLRERRAAASSTAWVTGSSGASSSQPPQLGDQRPRLRGGVKLVEAAVDRPGHGAWSHAWCRGRRNGPPPLLPCKVAVRHHRGWQPGQASDCRRRRRGRTPPGGAMRGAPRHRQGLRGRRDGSGPSLPWIRSLDRLGSQSRQTAGASVAGHEQQASDRSIDQQDHQL